MKTFAYISVNISDADLRKCEYIDFLVIFLPICITDDGFNIVKSGCEGRA